MMMTPENKIMIRRIPVGSSIGRHILSKSSETNYVIAGEGKQICDGVEEFFNTGMCIFCSKDSSQSITNIGKDDLILFTMTKEQDEAVYLILLKFTNLTAQVILIS